MCINLVLKQLWVGGGGGGGEKTGLDLNQKFG